MMRLSTLLLSVSAACALAIPALVSAQAALPAQSAPAAPIDEQAQQALSQVQVRGQPRRHRLDAGERRKVAGTYALSNGWMMHVVPHAREVELSINDGAPITLYAQTADRFATADGNVATVFNLGPWQDDVVLSYVPDSRMADQRVVIGSATLAAR